MADNPFNSQVVIYRAGLEKTGFKRFLGFRQGWTGGWTGGVVRERGGTPFRQIFWSRSGAPANIVGHRWNANTEAFRQITSYSLG